jgi:hypothetical protein
MPDGNGIPPLSLPLHRHCPAASWCTDLIFAVPLRSLKLNAADSLCTKSLEFSSVPDFKFAAEDTDWPVQMRGQNCRGGGESHLFIWKNRISFQTALEAGNNTLILLSQSPYV